jgi:hypothetical protein
VFIERQISRILPRAVEALVTADPDEARSFAEELKIPTGPIEDASRTGQLCAETIRLLNSEAKEGRQQARKILTHVLLNPVNIDESGEMIDSLLRTWREDLITTLRGIEGVEQVSLRGTSIEIAAAREQRHLVRPRVEKILQNELEHADWLVSAVTSRAALYRADLEEIVVALSDFCKQRSECSILLGGHSSRGSNRIGPLILSTLDEDDFLVEILEAIEGHLGALSREELPEPVTDIVERQILHPSEAPVYYEQLARLVLRSESLRATYPESEALSEEELTAEIKSRAERLMRIIERESLVLYERATYHSQRCASLARISPYASSTEAQLAKMVSQTGEELRFFVRDGETHRAHLERFRDRLYDLGGAEVDTWMIDRPHVFTLYIPGEDTITQEDLVLAFRVCMAEYEEPDFEDEMDYDDGEDYDSAIEETLEEEIYDAPVEDTKDQDEPTSLYDEADSLGEPLEFSVVALRPRGGDLLGDGERLALWFARLESKYAPLLSESSTPEALKGAQAASADEDSTWRYYGLSQARCEQLFRPFFNLIASRYPHVWNLLPAESREALTLMEISDFSPIRQAIDVLEMCEEYYDDITEFSPAEREAVQAWLRSYGEWCEAPTMDILYCLPAWQRASNLFKVGSEGGWRISQREDLLDEHRSFISHNLFAPELHLLLHSASERGMETMIELLDEGIVFLDGVSEAFVACLNTIPTAELKKRIAHRIKPALRAGSLSSFWEPIPERMARESILALRTHFGSIWVDIHRSFTRGLL